MMRATWTGGWEWGGTRRHHPLEQASLPFVTRHRRLGRYTTFSVFVITRTSTRMRILARTYQDTNTTRHAENHSQSLGAELHLERDGAELDDVGASCYEPRNDTHSSPLGHASCQMKPNARKERAGTGGFGRYFIGSNSQQEPASTGGSRVTLTSFASAKETRSRSNSPPFPPHQHTP